MGTFCNRRVRGTNVRCAGISGLLLILVALTGCEGGCRKTQDPAATKSEENKPVASSKQSAPDANPQAEQPPTTTTSKTDSANSKSPVTSSPSTSAEPQAKTTSVVEPKPALPKEDPQIERVYRDVLKLWDGVSVLSADVETEMQRAFEGPGHTRGLGQYHLLKVPGANPRIRYAIRNGIAFQMKDEHYIAPERVQWIADGEFIYQETQQPDVHRIDKRRYDPSLLLQVGGRDLFDRLREENVLSLREDAKLDGRDVYVIDAVAKDGGVRSVHTFDKTTGVRLQWDELDDNSKIIFHVKLYNLSLTDEFSADHFTFVMPQGAEMHDETN